MKIGAVAVLFAITLAAWIPSTASADPPPTALNGVRFDQRLDDQVPLELQFRDEQGALVKLADYVHGKPVVLTLNYFHCPNLCSLELDRLTNSFGDLPFKLGDQFDAITVSIDSRETPAIAAEKKWEYIRSYGRPGSDQAWHFLTGDQAAITSLTEAVGFHYFYDQVNDEFEHPTGVVVLTPEGRIARYLYGVDFPPRDLQLALDEASRGQISSPVDQILLFCYHYDPATGRYSLIALDAVRIGGVLTVLALGGFILALLRQEPKTKKRDNQAVN